MGFSIKLDTNFVGDGASNPVLYPDALMSAGSLLLIDGGHSAGGLSVTAGAQLPNVAWETFAALLGSGTLTSLSPTFEMGGTGIGCGKEHSPKGAIHVAAQQGGAVTNGQGYRVQRPTALQTYLVANPSHDYYASVWVNVTRAASSVSGVGCPIMAVADTTSSTGNFVAIMSSVAVAATNVIGHVETAGYNGAGVQMRNIGVTQATGTVDDIRPEIINWGAIGAWAGSLVSAPGNLLSYALYRAYIEDLTVSGRTYAQVSALDQAMYEAAFSSGGRFAGDTLTAAATLAGA